MHFPPSNFKRIGIILTVLIVSATHISSQTTVVDPTMKYQHFEGWGGSLCWWANIMGGYSDLDVKKISDWITDPQGLNMNIFRFNIGGGDDPTHNHFRTDGGTMPGYKASADAPFDWKQDENQRRILQQLIQSRINQTGENDIILEAFSNSPPFWMTKSGCSAGYHTGGVSNLKDDMYGAFADYLTEVVKYYHDSLGITFHTLTPFNEPYSTWWTALGGQEGCYFAQADQEKMIRVLHATLEEKNMSDYTSISAMDSNTLDECYNGVVAYKNAGDILPKLEIINTHSYFGSENARRNLARWCYDNNFKIWQSESGPLNISGTDQHLFLVMAARIIRDITEMNAVAWIDWQLAADRSAVWGLIVGNYSDPINPVYKGDGYFYRSQFSRFIKPGYTIVDAPNPSSLVALSPDEKELIIVVVNESTSNRNFTFDLSPAGEITGTIQRFRTREVNPTFTERLARVNINLEGKMLEYGAPAYSVTTFVIPIELPAHRVDNGQYMIKNKENGLFAGIHNASLFPGSRLSLTSGEPQAHATFNLSQDIIAGGSRLKPGHLSSQAILVLEVEGNSNIDGARIIQFEDTYAKNQRFHFHHVEGNYYNIVVRKNQMCWSPNNGESVHGTNIVQMTCNGSENQLWEITNLTTSVSPTAIERNEITVNYQFGKLKIFTPNQKSILELQIINASGLVTKHTSGIASSEYTTSTILAPGYYVVRVSFADGTTTSKSFLAF